jgi:hypothetical protein
MTDSGAPVDPCPSDLRWDRWDAKELSELDRQAMQTHAGRCVDCTERLEALRERRAAFQAAPPFPMPAKEQLQKAAGVGGGPGGPGAHGRRWGGLAVFGLGMAACVSLIMIVQDPAGESRGRMAAPTDIVTLKGGVRSAGGASLALHLKTPSGSSMLAPGAQVRPGDSVGFSVVISAAGLATLTARDAAGHVDQLWRGAVNRGSSTLPIAAKLDEVLGPTVFELTMRPADARGDTSNSTSNSTASVTVVSPKAAP